MSGAVDRELQAAAIVASILDARYDPQDRWKSGGPASHDFDLCFCDGREREPLEVTTAATGGAIATEKALRQESSLPAPELNLVWAVVPVMSQTTGQNRRTGKPKTGPYPLAERHGMVVECLKVLEVAGVDRFPSARWTSLDEPTGAALRRLGALGLMTGNSRPPRDGEAPGVEYVGIYGGVGRAQLLLAAIMLEACEPGNVGKLRGRAERRHLFIRVDHTSGDAHVAVRNKQLPDELPNLAEEITDIWIWADDRRAFQFTRDEGWIEHAVSEGALMHPERWELSSNRPA